MLSRSGFEGTLLIITQLLSWQTEEEEEDSKDAGKKRAEGEKRALLEKRKHNLIPALFELGTTCSLLKQLSGFFIIALFAAVTYAHMKKCLMCASKECFCVITFSMLKLFFKVSYFVDVS